MILIVNKMSARAMTSLQMTRSEPRAGAAKNSLRSNAYSANRPVPVYFS